PVIHTTVNIDHFTVFFDEFNCWQKALTLQAVPVKAVRHDIGGGNQGNTTLEKVLKKSTENHCISDIGNKKLIETDYPCFAGNPVSNLFQRIFFATQRLQIPMHSAHETVEVSTQLLFKGQAFVKIVHQIGFSTPYPTPEIETFYLRY